MLARWSRFARMPSSLSHRSFNRWLVEAAEAIMAAAAVSELRAITARTMHIQWNKAVSITDKSQIIILESESAAAVGDFVPDAAEEW